MAVEDYSRGDLASIGAGALATGAAGFAIAGPPGAIAGGIAGGIIGLINKNLGFLLLLLPLFIFTGIGSLFLKLPWYIIGSIVLMIILILLKR